MEFLCAWMHVSRGACPRNKGRIGHAALRVHQPELPARPCRGARAPARGRTRRGGQVSDCRQDVDHHHLRAGRPRPERQRDVHNEQGRQGCRRCAGGCRDGSARWRSACSPWTSRTTRACAASSTRPFAGAPFSTWSRTSSTIADELAADLFADGSPADLVERYARRLPLSVICELLGLPGADRPRFIAWASNLTRLTGMVSFLRMLPASGR